MTWTSYLDWFHRTRSGITEEVLVRADGAGMNPYAWLLDGLPTDRGVVALDVACGSGPLRANSVGRRWVGIDRSTGELALAARRAPGGLVLGDVMALPFADASVDLVACSMALMLFDPVDRALAEIRRVLADGGLAVFLLPGSIPLTARDRFRYLRLVAALHELQPAYPTRIHRGRLRARLARAGLVTIRDDRRRFAFALHDEHAARRFVESLYVPGRQTARVDGAARLASRWVGSEIGIPLRRIVCQKQTP
ncbi:MAG: class I SAM-dependent methyltransferase [Acidimicrobiales bacterium]